MCFGYYLAIMFPIVLCGGKKSKISNYCGSSFDLIISPSNTCLWMLLILNKEFGKFLENFLVSFLLYAQNIIISIKDAKIYFRALFFFQEKVERLWCSNNVKGKRNYAGINLINTNLFLSTDYMYPYKYVFEYLNQIFD